MLLHVSSKFIFCGLLYPTDFTVKIIFPGVFTQMFFPPIRIVESLATIGAGDPVSALMLLQMLLQGVCASQVLATGGADVHVPSTGV